MRWAKLGCVAGMLTAILYGGMVSKSFSYSKKNILFQKQKGYDVVKLKVKGASYWYRVGAPQMPVIPYTFVIPPDAEVRGLKIVNKKRILLGKYNIFPVQKAVPFSSKEPPPFVEPDPEIYNSSNPYPPQVAKITHVGTKNGFKLVTVSVSPLQYIPSTHELYFYPELSVQIEYKRTGKAKIEKLSSERYKLAKKIVSDLVVNPEDIDAFSPLTLAAVPVPNTQVEYVIIVDTSDINIDGLDHPEIYKALEPLAYWKTKKGVPTKIVVLDSIEANFSGLTIQDKIRNFIAYADTAWQVQYVLLVGEDDIDADDPAYGTDESDVGTWMPRKDVYITSSAAGYYSDEDTIAADFWYADWDGDLYQEVYVGRLLFDEATEAYSACSLFVYKTLTYEKNPPLGYQPRILLTSELLFRPSYGGIYVNDSIAKHDPPGFTDIYLDDQNLRNYSSVATIDTLNAGVGFWHAAGHGDEIGVMYGSGDPVQVSDIEGSLFNGDKLFIMYAISCFPGAYDYDSYAEHLMTLVGRGAVAFLLNYRYGWGDLNSLGRSEWQSIWFTKAWGSEGYDILGAAVDRMKSQQVPYVASDAIVNWCMQEYNLFGDPQLHIWTAVPVPMVVNHPTTITSSPSTFTVTVYDQDGVTPLDSALVTLWCKLEDTLYLRGYTDATGTVSFTVSPSLNSDTMWVTVVKYSNYLPYEGFAVIDITATGTTETQMIANESSEGVVIEIKGIPTSGKLTLYKKEENQNEYDVIYKGKITNSTYKYVDKNVEWAKTYLYKAVLNTASGGIQTLGPVRIHVSSYKSTLAIRSVLQHGNYTVIQFANDKEGIVKLYLKDISGRKVGVIFERNLAPGVYTFRWTNTLNSAPVPEGSYFLVLENKTKRAVKKIQILK